MVVRDLRRFALERRTIADVLIRLLICFDHLTGRDGTFFGYETLERSLDSVAERRIPLLAVMVDTGSIGRLEKSVIFVT